MNTLMRAARPAISRDRCAVGFGLFPRRGRDGVGNELLVLRPDAAQVTEIMKLYENLSEILMGANSSVAAAEEVTRPGSAEAAAEVDIVAHDELAASEVLLDEFGLAAFFDIGKQLLACDELLVDVVPCGASEADERPWKLLAVCADLRHGCGATRLGGPVVESGADRCALDRDRGLISSVRKGKEADTGKAPDSSFLMCFTTSLRLRGACGNAEKYWTSTPVWGHLTISMDFVT